MAVLPVDESDAVLSRPYMMAIEELTACLLVSVKPKKRRKIQRELLALADRLDHSGWADRVVRLRSPRPHSPEQQEDFARAKALRALVDKLL